MNVQNFNNDNLEINNMVFVMIEKMKKSSWLYNPIDFKNILQEYKNNNVSFSNPYNYLEIMKYYMPNNNNYITAINYIINEGLLYKSNGKRKPLLELKYNLYYSISKKFNLTEWDTIVLYFGCKLGYEFPGIIGDPVDELAFKTNGINSESSKLIVESQNATDIEGINTDYMISQTKGGLSLDFGFGCSMGCLYCYRIEDHREVYSTQQTPKFDFDAVEGVNRLMEHPWFTPHITPIGICMSTTEAFLPEVWPITIKVIHLLEKLKLTNRVTIITKGTLNSVQISELEKLEYVDLDICVCYAGLPSSIEPSSNVERLQFLKRINDGGKITAIGYLRPIIEGYNSSYESLVEVLKLYKETGVTTITYGGLRFSDEHILNFNDANLPLPNCIFEKNKKYLSLDTEKVIYKAFYEVFGKESTCSLFRHSSCARVNARDQFVPDYNCHYYAKKGCSYPCKKRELCFNPIRPSHKDINSLMERMFWNNVMYRFDGPKLIFNRSLTLFERNFLRQNILFPVFGEDEIEK